MSFEKSKPLSVLHNFDLVTFQCLELEEVGGSLSKMVIFNSF